MNRVFVISAPSGKNLEPAKQFGPLTVMLDGHETAIMAQDRLAEHLSLFHEDDFLLLIRHPLHIAAAAFELKNKVRHVKCLVWDRESQTYQETKLYA